MNDNDIFRRASLKTSLRLGVVLFCLLRLGALPAPAVDHYVTPPGGYGTNNPPYTNWADAATNIQWALDVSTNGETVWVTNGAYCITNQIMITNRITLRSMNGRSNTLVYADWPTYTTRCFYVSRTGTLDGFTISNGHWCVSNDYNGGGGAFATNAIIRNCYFVNNVCSNGAVLHGGGGVYSSGAC